jgi:hypothetical protein
MKDRPGGVSAIGAKGTVHPVPFFFAALPLLAR